ncbi:MAG: hypothetical protein LBQ93_06695 [Treponema sp.]|jgi:hypothetical protein|nr:hypothetical protein [Treponema sp.]
MKNIYRLAAAILLGFLCLPLFSVETSDRGEVEFNIRFFDRRIYYVQTDPIYVQITITNNSPFPYRFKLADERAFSIDFDVRTMTNRVLSQADALVSKRNQNIHVFFREITIESGESFSFVEDLRDYVSFSNAGSFRVRAKVYPELYRSTTTPQALESNYLSLSLRPPSIQGPDGIPVEMDVDTGAVLVRQRLSPDETVEYMLIARQQSHWEKFFLYLDLEGMLSREALQRRKYLAENEEGRRRMINDFRQSLQNSTADGDNGAISVIPTTFEIQRTVYNNEEGEVTALLKFRMPTYTELRRYTYKLEKQNNFWVIVNYSVQYLGTEANSN